MTDEPDDQLSTLASAYLDGEATPEEVARVEDDPDALAEVERLRQVRALVGDVEPPAISGREAQLAAALDAWDRLPDTERDGTPRSIAAAGVDPITAAAAASMSTPPPTGRGRKGTRSNGWIMAAAAGLVVVLAGGLALRSLNDDNSDDGSDAVESEQDAAVATAASEDGESSLSAMEATTDPSLEPSADIADTDTEADAVLDAPPPEDGLEDLQDPAQLAIYASDALDENGQVIMPNTAPAPARVESEESEDAAAGAGEAPADEEAPAADSAESALVEDDTTIELPLCGDADHVVGPALYQGELVVVAIDADSDLALAYVAESCELVAQARLP